MSFLLNDDRKILATPFRDLFSELARLTEGGDVDTLVAVRSKLVSELYAETDDENVLRKLRGIEWKYDLGYPQKGSIEDRVSYISSNLWNGVELVKKATQPGLGSF